jgi:hypothetical protein
MNLPRSYIASRISLLPIPGREREREGKQEFCNEGFSGQAAAGLLDEPYNQLTPLSGVTVEARPST